MQERQLETELIHRGEGAAPQASPLTTPIYETTTFLFESAAEVRQFAEGKSDKFLYSRYGNPTVAAVESKLAALERAEAAIVFSSGNAATACTVMALAQAGDEVLCSAAVYGGTFHLLKDLLAQFGITIRFITLEELNDAQTSISDRTRALWFETPTNPTLRCVDIRAVAAACRARGIISVLDNTFASPINQQPLTLGVDLVMHSATKYLNGHSDVTAGAVAGPREIVDKVNRVRRMLGPMLDPAAAYALGRGIKTLAVRVERQNANALALARALEKDKRVQAVHYPGLESHPDHAVAKAQMSGFGGMVCIDVGSLERAEQCFDRLQVFQRAASLGGVESLCSLPVLTSHWGYTEEALARAGVTPGMMRFSVGLENVNDLIADLQQALS
ncbi:MAG: aminotransferase class I/II-fold pyridoxal phosphate-dependent enzyme [Abitibacteriaceae bacterium]|nr:aminotransferase class I/II-fold pyridoxal phosphate-dependent enzyme [Abditibacteriaceae bacterium]